MAQKPRSRRKRGSGTIFQTKSGLYAYEMDLGKDEAGKRHRKRVYGQTVQEVKAKIQDLTAIGGGTLPPPETPKLSDYAARWLALIEKRVATRLSKATTAENYRWAWGHAAPLIGHIKIDRIDRPAVLRMIDGLQANGCSANTVNAVISKMGTLFNDAVKDGAYKGVLNNTPFHLVDRFKPKHTVKKGRALSQEECKKFLAAARNDRLEAAWVIGLDAGLRISEIFGLRWEDIDFENKTISVCRQAQDVGNKLVVSDILKTETAYRVVQITTQTIAALERRKTMKPKSIWVFGSKNPKTPVSPRNARSRSFAQIVKKADLSPLHPHDLRHTCASILMGLGVPESVVSQRLGHADSIITKSTYTHALKNQASEAVEKLQVFLTA